MFARPRIFASKCLGFAPCRWNGVAIDDDFVRSLKGHVEFVTACPEAEAGLGIPRNPIRIVLVSGEKRLLQPATGRDVTSEISGFAVKLLEKLRDVDGFILKDRSPSCGIDNVKVYRKTEPGPSVERSHGFFGGEVIKRFAGFPVETEGRLTNYRIREYFLTRIYAFADFRAVKKSGKVSGLVDFHTRHKFLIMSHSQKELSRLGRLLGGAKRPKDETLFREYEEHLRLAMSRVPGAASNINILTHALGYFKDKLESKEKKFYLDRLDDYKKKKIPLSVPLNIARSYIVRFDEPYLKRQSFFDPYPDVFAAVTDSGKGRT